MTLAADAMRSVTWRWSDNRLIKKATYHAGEVLARREGRVLTGKLRTGSPISLLASDHIQRHIYFFGEWEQAVTQQFRRLVKPGTVVFDIGANAGYFSLLSRDLGATVRAFEPHPAMAALLRRNLAEDAIVEAACSDRPGTATLHLSTRLNTGMTTLEPTTRSTGGETVQVSTITLDSYVKQTGLVPNLIKIDVERHELSVLEGARETLKRHRPTILAEVTSQAFLDAAAELGYDAAMVRDGHAPERFTALQGEECNALLTPR